MSRDVAAVAVAHFGVMNRRGNAVALTAALLLLSGCAGEGDSPSAQETVTVTVTPTTTLEASETPEASPTGGTEPNVGDQALRLGQTRQGRSFATTLHEIRFPYPTDNSYRVENKDNVLLGLRLTQCMSQDAEPVDEYGQPFYSTYTGDWAAVAPDGNQAAGGGSSWSDWPQPKFPENVTLNPGDCLKGWLVFEVPKSLKIEKVVWRPGGVTTAEWLP